MAFTVTQAIAVNTLLSFILGESSEPAAPIPTVTGSRAAAVLLAEYARKALGAGWAPRQVDRKFERRYGSADQWKTDQRKRKR